MFETKGHETFLVSKGATLYFFRDLTTFKWAEKDVAFQKKKGLCNF